MSTMHLDDLSARNDVLNRLKRAEGQLRGIQRMIEEAEPFNHVAGQMAAVRKALDSAHAHMTMCFMKGELSRRLGVPSDQHPTLESVIGDVQGLLGLAR